MEDLKDLKFISIRDLDKLNSDEKLLVDRTYQRASNWKLEQQQFFIDSIIRKFSIPMIYLHHVSGKYYIVDGQQRINSMIRYIHNQFRVLDPKTNRNIFPRYIREQESSWANKKFNELDNQTRLDILETRMPVAILEYEDHVIRDLFVRLQAGVPLTGQQKRDASVSGYNDFVLNIGGKEAKSDINFILKIENGIERFEGEPFFNECIKNTIMDKGNKRQLVAQVAMLYFELIDKGKWVDIGDKHLDEYYLDNIDFSNKKYKSEDFINTIDLLFDLIQVKDLKNHEVIHLILFTKFIKELNPEGWEEKIFDAFKKFRLNLSNSNKTDDEYWIKYGQFVGISAGSKNTILKRHRFFVDQMLAFISGNDNDYTKSDNWGLINTDPSNDRYLSLNMRNNIKAINVIISAKINGSVLHNLILSYFINGEIEENTNQIQGDRRQTHNITDINAYMNDGSQNNGTSPNNLVPKILTHLQGLQNNNAKVIFGEIDKNTGDFINPDTTFWSLVKYVTFKMNNTDYTIYRNDVETFCPKRYID
ncbi:MAG: DUF262 domain-containing protein [Chitinophagales bacterium]